MIENEITKSYFETQRERLVEIRDNLGQKTYGVEWGLRMVLQRLCFVVPSAYIKKCSDGKLLLRRRKDIEIYAFFKLLIVSVVVFSGLAALWIGLIILFIAGFDTFHALLCRIFLNKEWREEVSPKRNLIMAFVNYVEIAVCFAGAYLFCDQYQNPAKGYAFIIHNQIDVGTHHLTSTQAVYYSFVTGATVGYGDISAASAPAQFLVCLQVMVSLFFVVVIITNMMANFSKAGLANQQSDNCPSK
ncbi:ion channel [Mucilaginibacter sabulilitoris]|uniref:Ion channel n=1 Tax=Mucilaginibacter sabulilitoris TaxID=1173583 RepID=A0ABZ0TP79_9SPHI|nr:ion channel [Mucilaginibacter sabulilitoris]WPU94689.1 ion channel [Mucilaginibacter sabulilitoris]